ncbi:MAG: hypothetical protein NPIRA05_01320 [Nitrospirales bacterium]|nr:MAG: hypothetical protein NPIRA05_01320 [Nitrospirales bacterium]
MIAIDTNVLLRYLLADDAIQHRKAKALIEAPNVILLTDVVLAETVWTLAGKRYELDKDTLCEVLRSLIGDAAFRFENDQVIWSALMDYQESKPVRGKSLDFANCLITQKAHYVAAESSLELTGFYSFDKAVGQLNGTRAP